MRRVEARRAVLFDLDGTLVLPELDFDAIRREIGGIEGPVLEGISHFPEDEAVRARGILERHEMEAARRSRLTPYAAEVLDVLARRAIPTAILTRNSRPALATVMALHGLRVDATRTREDGPTKPSPEPVLALARALGVEPGSALVVGDYLFDLEAARAAGATAVLLRHEANGAWEEAADLVIRALPELLPLV